MTIDGFYFFISAAIVNISRENIMAEILKYNKAKLNIFQLISKSGLQEGDRLPSERELMERFDLTLITLRRAMKELEQEKIIRREPRLGTFLNQPIRDIPALGSLLYIRIYKSEYGERFLADNMRNALEETMKELHFDVIYRNEIHPGLPLMHAAASCAGIFVTGWVSEEWLTVLKSLGKPIVVIGEPVFSAECIKVSLDMCDAIKKIYLAIANRGCHKIGFINGGVTYAPAKYMHQGFIEAANECGHVVPESRIVWSTQTHMADDLTEYFTKNPDLDALIIENGARDAVIAFCWQHDYRKDLVIGAVAENRNELRPLAMLPDPVIAVCDMNPVDAAAKMMMELLDPAKAKDVKSLHLKTVIMNIREAVSHFAPPFAARICCGKSDAQ